MRTLASKLLDGYGEHTSSKILLLSGEMGIILATGLLISETPLPYGIYVGEMWPTLVVATCKSVIDHSSSKALQMVRESEIDYFIVYERD